MDVEDNVRKLLLMGFTDEHEIRRTLEATNYDINEAIALMMCNNRVRPTASVEDENEPEHATAASEPQISGVDTQPGPPELDRTYISGHDLTVEFSPTEFSHLQSRVYVDQWDIPCLRSQALGKCILGAIHELRADGLRSLESNPDCRQFILVCLTDCVTKMTTSQAVFNWDRETLEGVHNMLELAVRLICEYLAAFKRMVLEENKPGKTSSTEDPPILNPGKPTQKSPKCTAQFAWDLLRLLALIFDCEINYHQLCRDRSTNTGTYSDDFNDWTTIIEEKLEHTSVFAEILPSPRNFYLVNLINCFGVFDGFRLLHWLGTQRWITSNVEDYRRGLVAGHPVYSKMLYSVLLPVANCTDYLTAHTLQNECGAVLMQRVLWRLSNLSEDDFRDRDSRIFDLVTCLRVLTYRLSDLGIAHCLLPFLSLNDSTDAYQSPFEPDWEAFPKALPESPPEYLTTSFAINKVDKLHCTLLLSALSPPRGSAGVSFNGRMLALRNLVEQVEAAKGAGDSDSHSGGERSGLRPRPVHQYSSATLLATENAVFLLRRARRRAIRFEYLMTWFREKEVILKSMHNLDNTAYMTTLGQLFRLLGDRITSADLTTVWHRTTTQPGAAVDNILNLLTDVASTRFIKPQFDHLFYLVEASWLNLNREACCQLSPDKVRQPVARSLVSASYEPSHVRHGRARLLNLVGRIGIATKDAWKVDSCADLLWDLAHGTYSRIDNAASKDDTTSFTVGQPRSERRSAESNDKSLTDAARNYKHPEPIEAALAQQLVVLRDFRCSGNDQRLRSMHWLLAAVEHISMDSLTYFMLAYVKSLLELILKNFVGRAKRDSLNELIRTHDLINQVVTSLLRYEQRAVQSHGDLLSADSLDELGFRHSDVIKRHFELLHYLLRNAELSLSTDRARSLWECLIGHPRAASFDREQCFTWFTASLNFLEPETQTMLFTKLVLKSNTVLFRSFAGFECFKALFEKVNLHEGRMKQTNKVWHVEKPDLIGLDFLWDLYLALPSLDASLDGIHINPPAGGSSSRNANSTCLMGTTSATSVATTPGQSQPVDQNMMSSSAGCTTGPLTPMEQNAVKLARQLLLDVHWGQLSPRLRRDPEACYRRFFDACRRRLEASSAVGRDVVSKRGVHSALAETGQLLAALIVGPGPANRAKHCSKTAARLALRRLLGLVYAYIQTVEDEMLGARTQYPSWLPHGVTFRGWEMHLPLQVETLRPGQTTPVTVGLAGPGTASNPGFSPLDSSSVITKQSGTVRPVSLLVHSNEMLGSVRERANLVATAILFANRSGTDLGIGEMTQETSNWKASALYIGPVPISRDALNSWSSINSGSAQPSAAEPTGSSTDNKNGGTTERRCSKCIIETVVNRKAVGELGFQNGRLLTVRLITGLDGRAGSRAGRLSAGPMGASSLTLSYCSSGPSGVSLSAANASESDLVAQATVVLNKADANTSASRPMHSATDMPSLYGSGSKKQAHAQEEGLSQSHTSSQSSTQLLRVISLVSLSSLHSTGNLTAISTTDLSVNPPTVPISTSTHTLPSLCMGEDATVYDLLLDLAESELAPPSSAPEEIKRSRNVIAAATMGVELAPSFSLIHPIRLLLAVLPTYRPTSLSRSHSHLQQSLFCTPTNLLKSTPYRTLYKLQVLSAAVMPVNSTPWWDVSPGCLLSPPTQLYFTTNVFPNTSAASTYPSLGSISSHLRRNQPHTHSPSASANAHQPVNLLSSNSSDPKWFFSGDMLTTDSTHRLSSTSAPASPVHRRRRNYRLFGHSEFIGKSDKIRPSLAEQEPFNTKLAHRVNFGLVANVPPAEFLEPLVQLLMRQIPSSNQETANLSGGLPNSTHIPLAAQMQSTYFANLAWWRREVRHHCLQLLSFLLNPQGGQNLCASKINQSSDSEGCMTYLLHHLLTPVVVTDLLKALLETAINSAGVVETLPVSQTSLESRGFRKHQTVLPSYQPQKDSRAGVAGIIEVSGQNGRTLLFQDVEVAVQSIRLLFQCVMAYPDKFLEPFLNLDRLEEKLFRLLVCSSAARIRAETARQLEHLSLLSSCYLRFGEPCVRVLDVPSSDHSAAQVVTCQLHTRINYPHLLHFLLRTLCQARLPFYTTHIGLQSANIQSLLANSSEYFRVRAFLLGQTPDSLLKRWFKTSHTTILQEEFSSFRNVIDVDANFSKNTRQLADCLLSGHLESARVLCAQAVACVMSHSGCALSGMTTASSLSFDVHGKISCPTMYSGVDHRRVSVPTVLMEALAPVGREYPHLESPAGVSDDEGAQSDESVSCKMGSSLEGSVLSDSSFPISSKIALKISSRCLHLAREFLYYLITECLFPAAAHLLQTHPSSLITSTVTSSLEAYLSSFRALEPISLRTTTDLHIPNSSGSFRRSRTNVQTAKLLENVGPLTRRTAFNFLIFVSRMDVYSLERLPPDIVWDVQPALTGRSESGFVGLRNGGATCYMNAVLQQLFMQPGLPEAVLAITDTDNLEEDNILLQTQRLFGHLLESQLEYYDPVGFWKSFRPWDTSEALNPHEQQDAFDFFQALIDQLDEELRKLRKEPFFQAIYQGIFLDSKFCDECEHRYDREEVFSAINLAVKTHDLQEALNQFFRGEVLDGDNSYYCERCHVKRRTVKRLSVHTLPPVLCLHLKRFDFDWDRQVPVKFSDHFTFPRQLDMGPYLSHSAQKLRPEAFFSPNSSTSSLLQREARVGASATRKSQFHLFDGESTDSTSQVTAPVSSQDSTQSKQCINPSVLPTTVQERSDATASTKIQSEPGVSGHPPGVRKLGSGLAFTQQQQHVYRLVGIVVHSGQANSGHYYAFIKDRGRGDRKSQRDSSKVPVGTVVANPSETEVGEKSINVTAHQGLQSSQRNDPGTSPSHRESSTSCSRNRSSASTSFTDDPYTGWYRFNDTCVEPVELTDSILEHECFGGSYKVTGNDGRSCERRTRYWSAYLLFYERVDLNHAAFRRTLLGGKASPNETWDQEASVLTSLPVEPRLRPEDGSPKHPHLRFTLNEPTENESSNMICTQKSKTESTELLGSPAQGNDIGTTFESGCLMPRRVAQRIWAENWTFLRHRNVYSRDYFELIRGLCEGILEDGNSLRQEPQRGLMGTRLLAHFFFTSFICLHARSKAKISGALAEGQTMNMQALKDLSIQQNSEWMDLLVRLASTSPKACRWLMHYMSTNPMQPCLVYLLLAPKPGTRQQLANMLLTVLRVFYSFKETNILDGTLTVFINHLLGLVDSGIVAQHATEAGALFALLRGYTEMCSHSCLHLVNLKTTRRLLNYLMEPPQKIDCWDSQVSSYAASFNASAPTWADKLRSWTPAQQREMGNLYYILIYFILHTCFDEYRTIKIPPCDPNNPNNSAGVDGNTPPKQTFTPLMLRPQKETLAWLGLYHPSWNQNSTRTRPTLRNSAVSSLCKPTAASPLLPSKDSYLTGLYRFCEVLLRAYLENPATPSLASSLGLTGVSMTSGSVPSICVNPGSGTASSVDATASGASAAAFVSTTVKTTSSETAAKAVDESIPLRQLIRQGILHLSYCSWESSCCMIILLLSRVSTRPQSELRHLFDLLSELLRLVDPLQKARIAAVVDGLVDCSHPHSDVPPMTDASEGKIEQWIPPWSPRPNADPALWAWDSAEIELSSAAISAAQLHGAAANDDSTGEDDHARPLLPKGLLHLINNEAYQDPRRAYQCMKFIVQLSSETDAVTSYLSQFPQRWEPAVRWLENLMDYSEDTHEPYPNSSSPSRLVQKQSCLSRLGVDETDSGGLYMVISSPPDMTKSRQTPGLTDASNESDETHTGFLRTVSAQTTLREATRILGTMPRVPPTSTGLSAPLPNSRQSASAQMRLSAEPEEEEDEYDEDDQPQLFFKLST
ncbi:UBA/TS-N domain protein [Opisthorchis viverrini]|uniref:UBA/TS-N domain protein n=1 Tax=Opisthorchis viverrini TaxID=6198 RepID=A0A1S8XAW7_OPIVI|nr:UBA/TS-N domain protein [Opisthorchis viverrini]